MKKFMKIILTILAVFVVLMAALLIKNWIDSQKAYYKEQYFADFTSDYVLEQKYAGQGGYAVTNVTYDSENRAIRKIRIWYPAEMEHTDRAYPMIVAVNASNTAALNYKAFFERLASWGFIVVGNDDRQAGTGRTASETLDHMLSLNVDDKSIFCGKIDEERIGCVGYSQGGAGAINAVTRFENSGKFRSLYTGSAAYPLLAMAMGWEYDIGKIRIPYFMTAGTGTSDDNGGSIHSTKGIAGVAPLASLTENFDAISDDVRKVRARVTGAEHEEILLRTDGYMTAWMLYTLCGDAEAGQVFAGENPELTINRSWQDVEIHLGMES